MFWMFDNAPLGCMLLYKMSDQKKALFLPGARRILTLFLYLLSAIHIFASNLTFVPHVKISSKRPRSKRQVFTPRFLEAVGGSFEYSLQIIRFLPPNYQPSSTSRAPRPRLDVEHQDQCLAVGVKAVPERAGQGLAPARPRAASRAGCTSRKAPAARGRAGLRAAAKCAGWAAGRARSGR